MPNRIAVSTLNASTMDIMNVIRSNASYEYQQNVPVVEQATDIPKVGEIIYGTPAFSNQFINSLINRIAMVTVTSATFNNPYADLKKGYLEFGETVEEIFVNLAKPIEYNPDKGAQRELRRTLPDVKSAFHVMNWRVIYPVTIQDNDLKLAFLSNDGVLNLVAKIVEQVYTSANYDEFLLFKYMLIKAISHGQVKATTIGAGTDMSESAISFRGTSNQFTFMSNQYNEAGVMNVTPKDRQVIFMDADYNARFDVEVLARAFNMDKADFMGRLYLIDNWTSFDNDRFDIIRENSDGLEEVTADELGVLSKVKAVILDERWFQVYDNNNKFTEKYVASGLYWNYFYHVWKTISHSPFNNAVCFVTGDPVVPPTSFTAEIMSKDISEDAVVFAIQPQFDSASVEPRYVKFIQTEAMTSAGIGITPYGALYIPKSQTATEITLVAEIGGVTYTGATSISSANNVGATVSMAQG